ncbi:MAG: hypothetical protein Q7U04_07600, partial [Bacteriovorax sp.]|nr:hypothetical protein [Bacteriovorax sp.]
MRIFSLLTLLTILWPLTPKVYALGLSQALLLEVSSSKKTVILDRGLLENYTENSVAKFFVQSGDFKFPKIFLVAEGKLVKSLPRQSTWYFSKIYDPRFIASHAQLLVMISNEIKSGRSLKIKQRHVVISPKQYGTVDEYLDKNKNNVPDRLLVKASDYEEGDELYETKKIPESDVEIKTYEHLRKKSGNAFSDQYNDESEDKYFVGNNEVKLGDIKLAEDKKLLESMALGFIEKINSQKYDLTNGLYKEQIKEPG